MAVGTAPRSDRFVPQAAFSAGCILTKSRLQGGLPGGMVHLNRHLRELSSNDLVEARDKYHYSLLSKLKRLTARLFDPANDHRDYKPVMTEL
jgi:hypothetical protein